jgi:death-on-curing protein
VIEPVWVNRAALLLLHEESLATFGGSMGLRDEGLLESALERAHHRWTYQPASTIAELAACYGFALTKNHPMVDGNKRLGFLALGIFLLMNGRQLLADRAEAVIVMEDVASGKLDESGLAAWVESHSE